MKKEPFLFIPIASFHTMSNKLNHEQQKSIIRNLSFAFTLITKDGVVLNRRTNYY
ncbi:hypothetical protein Hanom_Chr09g00774891 [Helianthus anomalus]